MKTQRYPRRRFVPLLVAFACGCSSSPDAPDLGMLYEREAQYHGVERNPVIVIPGILGSRLISSKTGKVLWGAWTGDYAHPDNPEDVRLGIVPMAEGKRLADLEDEVVPDGVLDSLDLRLFGIPLSLRAYANILANLGVGGYRDEELGLSAIDYGDEHFTCFQFPYDWRRDNVENAKLLDAYIREKKAYVAEEWRKRYGPDAPEVKFDIVAHSMGGLVARYYLRYGATDLPDDGSLPEVTWAGARHVERAILVATPSAGATEAIVQLVRGLSFAPFLPTYGPALLGTFPSIYQLFPRARHRPLVDAADPQRSAGDPLDIELWKRLGWGLASTEIDDDLAVMLPDAPDAASRRRIALDHLNKCLDRARRFNAALDRPARRPEGLDLYLFAGDAVPTPAVLAVDPESGDVSTVREAAGDGTVLRTSALLDERVGQEWAPRLVTPIDWSGVMFLFTDHLTLTKDPAFTDNVLYYLLEDPR